jgi:hypothetical protein
VNSSLGFTEIFINPLHASLTARIREVQQFWPQFAGSTAEMIKDFEAEEYNLGISKLQDLLTIMGDYLKAVEKNKTSTKLLSADLQTILTTQKNALLASKAALTDRLTALPSLSVDPQININIEGERQELKQSIAAIEKQINQVTYQEDNQTKVLFSLPNIIKYTNLLASISKAENSAAVENLLESYTLPAGSSRIKKVSTFNFAVNAYVGGFFGRSGHEGEGFTNTYGLTAPIGFSLSTGFKEAGSLSLFTGIFDIGGTIRYKLDNDGKYQQNISLTGIVSPSVHLVYGFPWYLPLSIGAGCQWISPTTTSSNKIELKPTFNAFIAVDIPLFNLAGSKSIK